MFLICPRTIAQVDLEEFIQKTLESKPPRIDFLFYKDDFRKHSPKILMLVNSKPYKFIKGSEILLDTMSFKISDSISFCFIKGKDSIYTGKKDYRTFLHGGEIIFGTLSDYKKEREAFMKNSAKYLIKNEKNYLYDLLNLTVRNDSGVWRRRMTYSIMKSNLHSAINTSWHFE